MTFTMWSLFHYIFIISPFAFAIALYFLTKKTIESKKRILGIILSVLCILLLVLRNWEIYNKSGNRFQPEIIPLQICHFANFVLLFAFLFQSKTMHTVAFCFNLPFAFLSILFANSLENYATVLTFRGIAYLFGHMLIVGITIWAMASGMVKITRQALLRGLIFILVMFILSVPINNLFNAIMPDFSANYFYTMAPEEGTPLELAFSFGSEITVLGMKMNPIYILTTAAFGSVVYFGIYGIYYAINRLFLKR